MYFSIILLTHLFILPYVTSKDICNVQLNCSDCESCTKISECNFNNIFCRNNSSIERLTFVHNNLTEYYKKDPDITSFCNSRNIILESVKDSFTIFESNSETLSGTLTKLYFCEYLITNKYYYDHETDQAKIIIELTSKEKNIPEESRIKFNILFLYNSYGDYKLYQISDQNLRESYHVRILDKLSEVEILVNFKNNNTENVLESLVIRIDTDNPSEKIKIIYLAIIIILSFFILVIVVLIVVYYILRRRVALEREEMMLEEEKKIRERKKLTEEFLKNELKSEIFSDKLNFNDNDVCTICFEKFVIGESNVAVTPCLHVFHHECIEKWIKEKITEPHCPNCKFSFIEYMENPTKIDVKKKENKNFNINNKENKDNINNIDKKIGEENIAASEHLRINSLTRQENNINSINSNNINNINNNINNNQSEEEGSVHISDE